jgi:hypothetical protein
LIAQAAEYSPLLLDRSYVPKEHGSSDGERADCQRMIRGSEEALATCRSSLDRASIGQD